MHILKLCMYECIVCMNIHMYVVFVLIYKENFMFCGYAALIMIGCLLFLFIRIYFILFRLCEHFWFTFSIDVCRMARNIERKKRISLDSAPNFIYEHYL